MYVCYKLQDLGISYKVEEKSVSLGYHMRINRRYEIFVTVADYGRAKSGQELEEDPPEAISEREWQEMEEPVDTDALEAPEGFDERPESTNQEDVLPDTPKRRDAYFGDWYPEDATVQVWPHLGAEGAEDISFGIEMAFKENLIHCRGEDDGGNKKFFVLPDDESRAREIIREILEGAPPE